MRRVSRHGRPQLTIAAKADALAAAHITLLSAKPNTVCGAAPDWDALTVAEANSDAITDTPTAPATDLNITGLAVTMPISGTGAEFCATTVTSGNSAPMPMPRGSKQADKAISETPGSRTNTPSPKKAAVTHAQATNAVLRTLSVAARTRPQAMDATVIPAISGIKCKPESAGDKPRAF